MQLFKNIFYARVSIHYEYKMNNISDFLLIDIDIGDDPDCFRKNENNMAEGEIPKLRNSIY